MAGRDRRKPLYVFALLGLAVLVYSPFAWVYPNDFLDPGAVITAAILVQVMLKWWIAIEASRQFNDDRQSGALELLLSTPMPVSQIVRGQWLALFRQFGWPGGLMVVLHLGVFQKWSMDRYATGGSEFPLVIIASIIVFVSDMIALAWLGMWRGLTSRSVNRAAGGTLWRILFAPWVAYVLLLTGIVVSNSSVGMLDSTSVVLGLALVVFVGFDLYFIFTSMDGLKRRFRTVATQRFEGSGRNKPGGEIDAGTDAVVAGSATTSLN